MNNTGISAKRITALLCALVFVLSLALTGCQIGSSDEGKTTTTEPTGSNQALEYVDPNQGIVCPKCGSSNIDDAWREGEEYDEHYICYDCNYEWYVLNGIAFEIKDNGEVLVKKSVSGDEMVAIQDIIGATEIDPPSRIDEDFIENLAKEYDEQLLQNCSCVGG